MTEPGEPQPQRSGGRTAPWRTEERRVLLTEEYEAGKPLEAIEDEIRKMDGDKSFSRGAVLQWAYALKLRRPPVVRRVRPAACEPPPEHSGAADHLLNDGQVWRWVSGRWNRPGISITAQYAAEHGMAWVAVAGKQQVERGGGRRARVLSAGGGAQFLPPLRSLGAE